MTRRSFLGAIPAAWALAKARLNGETRPVAPSVEPLQPYVTMTSSRGTASEVLYIDLSVRDPISKLTPVYRTTNMSSGQ